MLYWLGSYLSNYWGPFRLLSSHLTLLAVGAMFAALAVWFLLPRLWDKLPHDHGKQQAADGGTESKGKPTGAGGLITLILLPIITLFAPMGRWEACTLASLYGIMITGFLDDESKTPWGEIRKGMLDLLFAALATVFIYLEQGSTIWIPGTKAVFTISPWLYIAGGTILLWMAINATNCSDGVDSLAGSLTLMELFFFAGILYGVVGYAPIAKYLLVPLNPNGARWAILLMICAGGMTGYLWHNAYPSAVLMGDAGSRFYGLLVGVACLVTGNPLLLFIVAPVVLANGGTGIVKLVVLRFFRVLGFQVTPPSRLPEEERKKVPGFIKLLHKVRFPLHDHFKLLGWSKPQILVRFVLIQSFLMPLLFIISVKIR